MYPDSRHLNDYIELGITIQMHAPTVVLFGNAERELVTSTTSDWKFTKKPDVFVPLPINRKLSFIR